MANGRANAVWNEELVPADAEKPPASRRLRSWARSVQTALAKRPWNCGC
jgi:hypothetical protein